MRWPAVAFLAGLVAGTGIIVGLPVLSIPVRVAALVVAVVATGGWAALQLGATPESDSAKKPSGGGELLLPERASFFISYARPDLKWAEWIAWELEEAGYLTILQAWDFRPAQSFVQWMHQAVEEAERTILVLSDAYLASAFATAEWQAVFAKDPTGQYGMLLPVRVGEVEPPGLLRGRIYIDLVGVDRATASARLLEGVRRRGKPAIAPEFPGLTADTLEPPPFPTTGRTTTSHRQLS